MRFIPPAAVILLLKDTIALLKCKKSFA